MSRILVISDDQVFAYSLRVLLMRDGHSVMVAEDASAGLFRLFMDEPRFVVVNLRLEGEVRKVCRHLHENAAVPFLVVGVPALLRHPEFKTWLPPGSFQPHPVSVRRVWSAAGIILREHPDPPAKVSAHGPEPEGRGVSGGPDGPRRRSHGRGSADRHCRTYERCRRMHPARGRSSMLQIWV